MWVLVLKSGFIAPEQQAESFLKLFWGEVLSTTRTPTGGQKRERLLVEVDSTLSLELGMSQVQSFPEQYTFC